MSTAARRIPFPEAARPALADAQLRRNLGHATRTIRAKRAGVVEELPDWETLREAGRALKERTLRHLDDYLEQFEAAVQAAGGHVHWARDAGEANRIVAGLASDHGADEVVKVKSLASDEVELNDALAGAGVRAVETDLAELIVQLADDRQSHILVPAIHLGRAEIRELFLRELDVDELSDDPAEIAEAARLHLRRAFLRAKVGFSGANFGVAETGTVCVVESEGNGRMCITLPPVLITLMGIEKLVPSWRDLEVFLQLLPRSSTGERMNPYTSLWTGTTRRRRPAGVPRDPAGQRPNRRARGRGRAPDAQLHPLQRLPQRLPRLHAHRRTCVPLDLPGPDRRHPDPAARGPRRGRIAPVRIEPVRGLLRGVSGQDRHSARAGPPSRAGRRAATFRAWAGGSGPSPTPSAPR